VAIGYGGVWVLNAPDLLFFGRRTAKQSAAKWCSGFGRTDTHEIAEFTDVGTGRMALRIERRVQSKPHSLEQRPGLPIQTARSGGCTRARAEFQIVSEGTSNPTALPWDTEGSAIVEACHWANDHLFQFVETGHYQRAGRHFSTVHDSDRSDLPTTAIKRRLTAASRFSTRTHIRRGSANASWSATFTAARFNVDRFATRRRDLSGQGRSGFVERQRRVVHCPWR